MRMTPEEIINELELVPHPEGGFFKESYRSNESYLFEGYEGARNCATAIYYLLVKDDISAFHRIKQDETWHFYGGAPLELHILSDTGKHKIIILGTNLHLGEVPQYTVSGGHYFAARVTKSGMYSLMGCTVAPGFDFKDFELPERSTMIKQFPKHKELISELTK